MEIQALQGARVLLEKQVQERQGLWEALGPQERQVLLEMLDLRVTRDLQEIQALQDQPDRPDQQAQREVPLDSALQPPAPDQSVLPQVVRIQQKSLPFLFQQVLPDQQGQPDLLDLPDLPDLLDLPDQQVMTVQMEQPDRPDLQVQPDLPDLRVQQDRQDLPEQRQVSAHLLLLPVQ